MLERIHRQRRAISHDRGFVRRGFVRRVRFVLQRVARRRNRQTAVSRSQWFHSCEAFLFALGFWGTLSESSAQRGPVGRALLAGPAVQGRSRGAQFGRRTSAGTSSMRSGARRLIQRKPLSRPRAKRAFSSCSAIYRVSNEHGEGHAKREPSQRDRSATWRRDRSKLESTRASRDRARKGVAWRPFDARSPLPGMGIAVEIEALSRLWCIPDRWACCVAPEIAPHRRCRRRRLRRSPFPRAGWPGTGEIAPGIGSRRARLHPFGINERVQV